MNSHQFALCSTAFKKFIEGYEQKNKKDEIALRLLRKHWLEDKDASVDGLFKIKEYHKHLSHSTPELKEYASLCMDMRLKLMNSSEFIPSHISYSDQTRMPFYVHNPDIDLIPDEIRSGLFANPTIEYNRKFEEWQEADDTTSVIGQYARVLAFYHNELDALEQHNYTEYEKEIRRGLLLQGRESAYDTVEEKYPHLLDDITDAVGEYQ